MTILLGTYHALPEDNRKLVLLSAICNEPMTVTQFKNLLIQLGWRSTKDRGLYQGFDNAVRAQVVSAGIWVNKDIRIQTRSAAIELTVG
ncbi:hypothetical protein CCP3SC1_20094 [Gammaproteobacteria bacterium]